MRTEICIKIDQIHILSWEIEVRFSVGGLGEKWHADAYRTWQLCKWKINYHFCIKKWCDHTPIHWYKLENASSWELSRNPAHMYPPHPQGFSIKGKESWLESGPAFEKSGQACIWLQKCQREAKQRQARAGERQTNNKQKSLQESKLSSGNAETGQEDSSCSTFRLIEVIWTCILGFRVWWTWSRW